MGNQNNKIKKLPNKEENKEIINLNEPKLKEYYKIVFVGESGIGSKTGLINKLEEMESKDNEQTNMNGNYVVLKIKLENKSEIVLNLFDTIGQEKYRPLTKLIMKDSDCAVIGYDITYKHSFEEAKKFWYPAAKEVNLSNLIYLVANKIDLFENEEVNREEAIEFAKSNNLRFFEISVKTGQGIKEFLNDLVHNLINLENIEN